MGSIGRCVLASVLSAALGAQARLLVPAQYPDLAAAVAAAQDGDAIEFAAGTHFVGGVTIAKSLTLIGAANTVFYCGFSGSLRLQFSIPAGKSITVAGIGFGAGFGANMELDIESCSGRVTLLDCAHLGTIRVNASSQVLLARCSVQGFPLSPSEGAVIPPGLTVTGSTLVLDHCTVHGTAASYERSTPSTVAMRLSGADVRVVDSACQGGNAGAHLGSPLPPGTAAISATGTQLRLSGPGTQVIAGSASPVAALLMQLSQLSVEPTMTISSTLTTTTVTTLVRPRVAAANLLAGQTASLTLLSPAGTLGALLFGFPGDRAPVPGVVGDLWLDATHFCVPRIGVQNGAFTWTAAVPAVWPFPAEFRWQGLVFDNGTLTLTDPGAALLH